MTNARKIVPWIILAAALCLIAAGLLEGGFREVMGKAALVCLECIGIG